MAVYFWNTEFVKRCIIVMYIESVKQIECKKSLILFDVLRFISAEDSDAPRPVTEYNRPVNFSKCAANQVLYRSSVHEP